jgi:hypothetical protein
VASGTHERPEKILLAMFHLSEGTTSLLKYEDIVVKAFEMFPEEFALRGYPKYPDSSDIHKPLYGPLKRKGLVRSAQKTFALTPSGVQVAKDLAKGNEAKIEQVRGANRLTRDVEAELRRIFDSTAFRLYLEGKKEKILDTDFFTFLGCTVRTPRNDFLGRLSSTQNAISIASKANHPSPDTSNKLTALWNYLNTEFRPQIDRRRETT